MKLVIALALACACVINATVVTGTLAVPTGERPSGTCTFRSAAPFTAGGVRVIGASITVPFVNGALRVDLLPTDSAVPRGQYYQVSCSAPAQRVNGKSIDAYTWGPKIWTVPTSSSPIDISAAEVTTIPTPSLAVQPTQLIAAGLASGTYCLNITNGFVTGFLACRPGGGTPSGVSWSALTLDAWSTLTDNQWASLTN